jgi:hypothetical protein
MSLSNSSPPTSDPVVENAPPVTRTLRHNPIFAPLMRVKPDQLRLSPEPRSSMSCQDECKSNVNCEGFLYDETSRLCHFEDYDPLKPSQPLIYHNNDTTIYHKLLTRKENAEIATIYDCCLLPAHYVPDLFRPVETFNYTAINVVVPKLIIRCSILDVMFMSMNDVFQICARDASLSPDDKQGKNYMYGRYGQVDVWAHALLAKNQGINLHWRSAKSENASNLTLAKMVDELKRVMKFVGDKEPITVENFTLRQPVSSLIMARMNGTIVDAIMIAAIGANVSGFFTREATMSNRGDIFLLQHNSNGYASEFSFHNHTVYWLNKDLSARTRPMWEQNPVSVLEKPADFDTQSIAHLYSPPQGYSNLMDLWVGFQPDFAVGRDKIVTPTNSKFTTSKYLSDGFIVIYVLAGVLVLLVLGYFVWGRKNKNSRPLVKS